MGTKSFYGMGQGSFYGSGMYGSGQSSTEAIEKELGPTSIVSFNDGLKNKPLKECVVNIEPVQDLHGYDAPWPAGGGKNKINIPNNIDSTASGIRFKSKDAGIDISGVATDVYPQKSLIPYTSGLLNVGETYTISQKVTGAIPTGAHVYFVVREYDGQSVLNHSLREISSVTFTVEKPNISVLIVAEGNGVSYDNLLLQFQCEIGTTATSWTPYSNICPITGWTGANVTRTGKNLLKLVETEMISSGWDRSFPISVKEGKYIISCQNDFGASSKLGAKVVLVDESYTDIKALTTVHNFERDNYRVGEAVTMTAEEASKIKRINFHLRAGGATYNDIAQGNLQLELGSTATAYEPYQGTTYPVTWQTEAGTVYGGTLDVTNGVLTVDRAMVACTSSTSITKYSTLTAGGFTRFSFTPSPTMEGGAGMDGICDKLPVGKITSTVPVVVLGVGGGSNINILSSLTDLATFKSWLDNIGGLNIVYPLKDPVEYTLTPIQISTLLGENNVWADTDNVTLTYKAKK